MPKQSETTAQPVTDSGPLLTVAEVSRALSVSTRTVARLITAKKLRTVRIGRVLRIDAGSVKEFVDRGGTTG